MSTDSTSRTHIALVGSVDQVADVRPYLPRRWATIRYPSVASAEPADIVVLGDATPALVEAAQFLHPRATIIAVVGAADPVDTIIDVLNAGADTCVRASAPAVLASHVIAGYRRRQSPWLHAA